MSKYIWIRGQRYYYWDSYNTWKEAYKVARYYNKKNKRNRYFIQKVDSGFVFPTIKYRLYMNKTFRIGLFG